MCSIDWGAIAHWIEALAAASAVVVASFAIFAPDLIRRKEAALNATRSARELLEPISRLETELARQDLFSRNRQIDWMIAVQQANLGYLRQTSYRYLRANRNEDDIYFTWIISRMTLDALTYIKDHAGAPDEAERIAACELRAKDRLEVIRNRIE